MRGEDRSAMLAGVLRITDQIAEAELVPRHVRAAPAGNPTATWAACRRESRSDRTSRGSARSHD